MDSEKEIHGKCPHCKRDTKFREFTFTECLTSLGGFVGGFLTGGLSSKAKHSSALVNSFSDSREFPNYKCGACGGEVMQCSACKEIIPYEHDGTSHVCGATRPQITNSIVSSQSDDVISKLERLASLREKGLLTESEFAQQKSKLLE